jgi:NAD(P)H-flavin reductase
VTAIAEAMIPEPARVVDARRETSDVVTLTIAAPRPFRAGQFNMLYAFGVGEVPISMSGPPSRADVQIHTIRAVGAVTTALCRLREGATVGVRGPYGAPWPVDRARTSDLVIVAGGLGLAPLRPVIYQLLEQPERGRLVVLVGARTPEDLLFRDELEAWQRRADLTVLVTVDRAPTGWRGRVGVVPALLADVELAADHTIAFVCGPEVMMRFSIRELSRRGIADERIYVSMERNMNCGIGLCGHCQYGPDFICKDGPVLGYDRLRSRFWLREI